MYGHSEEVVGEISAKLGLRGRLFLATKVWTTGRQAGIAEMEESARRPRASRIDLMQVHNLLDVDTQLATLRARKEQGGCATSASRTTRLRPTRRWRACSGARSSTSCRSTTRSSSRRRKPRFCPWRPPRSRGHREPALWRRIEAAAGRRPTDALVGRGRARLLVLGRALPEMDPRPPERHVRDPRNGKARAPRAEHARRTRGGSPTKPGGARLPS